MYDSTLSILQLPIDDIPINIAVYRYIDGDFIFIDFNNMAEKTENISKEEVIGKYLTRVFPGVKKLGLFDVLLHVHEKGGHEECDLGFYEDERISGWRHNRVNRLPNGDIIVFYTDMTKQKHLENEGLKQKNQFEAAQEIAHLGSWEWDIKSNEIIWSDEVFRIFGEEPQSFTPTYDRFLSYLCDEGKSALKEAVADAIDNKKTYLFEHNIHRKDGTVRFVQESGNAQFNDQREAISMIGTVLDITERKEAEDQLQSLGHIVDNGISEVYIFDTNNLQFTYVNERAQKNTGYTLEELKQITPIDIKSEYTKRSFLLLLKPLLNGSTKELVFEMIHCRKNGQEYNVEIRLNMMEVNGKNQFVVIAHDITDRKFVQLQLQESEEKFRTIAENALMGIFIYHEHFVYVNQAFASMSEHTIEELYKMGPLDLIKEPHQDIFKQVIKRRLKGDHFPKEYNDIKFVTKSGRVKTMRMITQTIRYKDKYAGMGTIIDITDIQETKQQLKLLAQAVEQMDTLVRITNKKGVITYINDALVAHTGYRHIELIGKKVGLFKSGHHNKSFYKELWETILSGNTYKGIFVNRKKDRQIYYEEEIITPIMDDNHTIQHFVATSQDITERVHMEEKLQKLAMTDNLTGIYNRHKSNEELDIEIGRDRRYDGTFAIAMFDIDHFKTVNDKYGHDIGDFVLKEFSTLISKHIRDSDRFGRWGGEEFILLLPNLDKKEAMSVAQKLRKIVAKYAFKDIPQITTSIGVTVFTTDDTKESMLKRVDNALYKAKKSGRNKVRFK